MGCPYRGWRGYNPIWVVPIGPPCWVSTHRFHPFVLTPNLFYSTESVGENDRIWGDICVCFGVWSHLGCPYRAAMLGVHPLVPSLHIDPNLLYSTKFVGENDRIWGDICVSFGMWSHIRCPYRGWRGYNPIWDVPIGDGGDIIPFGLSL